MDPEFLLADYFNRHFVKTYKIVCSTVFRHITYLIIICKILIFKMASFSHCGENCSNVSSTYDSSTTEEDYTPIDLSSKNTGISNIAAELNITNNSTEKKEPPITQNNRDNRDNSPPGLEIDHRDDVGYHTMKRSSATRRSLLNQFNECDSAPEGEQIQLSVCGENQTGTRACSSTEHRSFAGVQSLGAEPFQNNSASNGIKFNPQLFATPQFPPSTSPFTAPNAPQRRKPYSRVQRYPYTNRSTGRAKHPSFANYHRRLASYTDWPTQMAQAPEDMATAGFFYDRIGDTVTCFHCSKTLKRWEENDDPMVEHKHFSPSCEFLMSIWGNGHWDY